MQDERDKIVVTLPVRWPIANSVRAEQEGGEGGGGCRAGAIRAYEKKRRTRAAMAVITIEMMTIDVIGA